VKLEQSSLIAKLFKEIRLMSDISINTSNLIPHASYLRPVLKTEELLIGYKKSGREKVIAGPVDLTLLEGEFACMIGQNGSGKTTLLKTLAGVHQPLKGKVIIDGKNIDDSKGEELAKKLSVVLTDRISVSNLNVYTLVSLGRYPYTNWMGGLSKKDQAIIEWALESTHTAVFANRKLTELSDGELQKVLIARALAQDTEIILLDEPTAHLDLPNRIEIFELLKKLARETQKAVLLSTHELDLALHSADKIWLIYNSQNEEGTTNQITSGVPEDLVLNGSFEKAFENRGLVFDRVNGRFKLPSTKRKIVNLSGSEVYTYWTSIALEREGFEVDNQATSDITLETDEETHSWKGTIEGKEFIAYSIEDLLKHLKS
jgi:iron complex transport system ATP-binding protein